jgi:hypothetical protein
MGASPKPPASLRSHYAKKASEKNEYVSIQYVRLYGRGRRGEVWKYGSMEGVKFGRVKSTGKMLQ